MGRALSFYKHKLFHYFHKFTNAPPEHLIVALTFPKPRKTASRLNFSSFNWRESWHSKRS